MLTNFDLYNWSNSTFIFYISLCLICYFISNLLKKITLTFNKTKLLGLDVIVVGTILLFVKGLTTCGTDINNGYKLDFISATSYVSFYDKSIEPAFILLNLIVKRLFDNYQAFLFIIAFITIAPVLYFINKYRNIIDSSLAVFLYVSIFFFSGISTMRLYLAASVALFAFDSIIERKKYKALVFIFIAMLLHNASSCLLIPYVFVFFKRINKKTIFLSLILIFSVIYIGKNSISMLFVGRHSIYQVFDTVKFGFEQMFYYVPIIILYFCARKYKKSISLDKINFTYILSGFFFGMLGYIVSIFGRIQGVFLPVIFIIAYYSKILKSNTKKWYLVNFIVLMYGLFRLYMYLVGYFSADGIMPYTNIFNWVI